MQNEQGNSAVQSSNCLMSSHEVRETASRSIKVVIPSKDQRQKVAKLKKRVEGLEKKKLRLVRSSSKLSK